MTTGIFRVKKLYSNEAQFTFACETVKQDFRHNIMDYRIGNECVK